MSSPFHEIRAPDPALRSAGYYAHKGGHSTKDRPRGAAMIAWSSLSNAARGLLHHQPVLAISIIAGPNGPETVPHLLVQRTRRGVAPTECQPHERCVDLSFALDEQASANPLAPSSYFHPDGSDPADFRPALASDHETENSVPPLRDKSNGVGCEEGQRDVEARPSILAKGSFESGPQPEVIPPPDRPDLILTRALVFHRSHSVPD